MSAIVKERIGISKRAKRDMSVLDTIDSERLRTLFHELAEFHNVREILFEYFSNVDAHHLLKYAKACGPKYYSLDGYRRYMGYRKQNPTDTASYNYLIALYGDGKHADSIFEKRFKYRSNCYDANYVATRDKIDIEEATRNISEYKSAKATSLDGFIRRHGGEKGRFLFENFQKASSKSSDFNHWMQNYSGNDPEKDWKFYLRSRSKRCDEFWLRNGFSKEEAKKLVSFHQRMNSGVHKDFYRARGYSETEIQKIFDDINMRKDGCSLAGITAKNPDLTSDEVMLRYETICGKKSIPLSPETLVKIRNTLEKNGVWVPLEMICEYERYKREVERETKKNDLSLLENHSLRGLAGVEGAYQLDHMFSVRQGFLNNVPAKIIGSKHNLVFVPWGENVMKQDRCSVSLEELKRKYDEEN